MRFNAVVFLACPTNSVDRLEGSFTLELGVQSEDYEAGCSRICRFPSRRPPVFARGLIHAAENPTAGIEKRAYHHTGVLHPGNPHPWRGHLLRLRRAGEAHQGEGRSAEKREKRQG